MKTPFLINFMTTLMCHKISEAHLKAHGFVFVVSLSYHIVVSLSVFIHHFQCPFYPYTLSPHVYSNHHQIWRKVW